MTVGNTLAIDTPNNTQQNHNAVRDFENIRRIIKLSEHPKMSEKSIVLDENLVATQTASNLPHINVPYEFIKILKSQQQVITQKTALT